MEILKVKKVMCMCAKLLQLYPTLYNPMDCNLPDSSVRGILQARILEWVAISSSKGSSQPRDWTHVSCSSWIADGFFTAEPPGKSLKKSLFSQFKQAI